MPNTVSAPTGSSADTDTKSPAPKGMWSMVKQTWADFSQDNAMRLAAAMACYVMLALAPMIIVAFKVLYLVLKGRTSTVIKEQSQQLIGPSAGEAIGQMIENASKPGSGRMATIISLLIVLFSASGVFMSLQDALNTIWEVRPKPNAGWWQFIRKRFLSMGMVLGIAVLLLTSMIVTAALSVIVHAVVGSDPQANFVAKGAGYALDFVVTTAVAWALLMAVFKFLPDAKVVWKDVWVGGLVTAVLFKLGQIGMAIYFNHGATSAYGTFGSIVAVLLWAYYSSIIMFLGAEFTQVWARAHGREIQPEAHAVKVTEEERAQEGIPSPARLAGNAPGSNQAGRGATARTSGPTRIVNAPVHQAGGMSPLATYAIAGGGLLVGAIAGALGANNLKKDPKQVTRRTAAAINLDQRIHAVELRLGRVSRLKGYLDDLNVSDRIDRVEDRLRYATTTFRAQKTGRPRWIVRLGEMVAGG